MFKLITMKKHLILYFVAIVLCILSFTTIVCACNKNESTCYRGSCINETCQCDIGWKGNLCEHCDGRVLLSNASGKCLCILFYGSDYQPLCRLLVSSINHFTISPVLLYTLGDFNVHIIAGNGHCGDGNIKEMYTH